VANLIHPQGVLKQNKIFMISTTINQKIAEALKAKDVIRLSTLRLLSSAFNYERITKQHELSEDEEIVVVKRETKKRVEAMEAIRLAQGKQSSSDSATLEKRLEQEKKELDILKEYLPEEIGEEELNQLISDSINQLGAQSIQEMGQVIGTVMQKAAGRADGKKVAEKVKELLGTRH